MARVRFLYMPAAFSLVLFNCGCGNDCPSIATSCSTDGCHAMRAYPFNADLGCVEAKSPEIVGCTPDEVGTADAPCVKRLSDGALFIATQGSPFRGALGWTECTDEERAVVVFCSE